MAPALRTILRSSRAWLLPTAAFALHTCLYKSRLDTASGDGSVEGSSDLTVAKTRAAAIVAARRDLILQGAREFTTFVDRSPSVFHAVHEIKTQLLTQNFYEIREKDDWSETIQPGGRYFVIRSGVSGTSLIAFAVGGQWQPGNPFSIVATHIDSPCLKIKPVSDLTSAGYRQASVETYGGGLWHTWFDRDLGAAGRAYVRTGKDTIEGFLVQLDEPIMRIPNLCTHYRTKNAFEFDTEQHLLPVISQKTEEPSVEDLSSAVSRDLKLHVTGMNYQMTPASKRHSDQLVHKIAEQLSTHPDNVVDFDLALYDIQKASLGGLNDEFIFSARIDNLMMTYCTLRGFLDSLAKTGSLEEETGIRTFVAYDNEEIGSVGSISAQSPFLPETLKRISSLPVGGKPAPPAAFERAVARSLLISSDMHHGVHPNYHGYHDINHKTYLNGGVALVSTSRSALAKSQPDTIRLFELICRVNHPDSVDPDADPLDPKIIREKIETAPPNTQFFVPTNNRSSGSTVGPHLEAKLGIRVVEAGNMALSMHSIREMAGSADVDNARRFMRMFYENYSMYEDWVSAR